MRSRRCFNKSSSRDKSRSCDATAVLSGIYVIISLRLTRSISIIIPAYNEEKRLPATLTKVKDYLQSAPWEFCEIMVVDDGSLDGTAELARCSGVRLVQNPGNCGKGYSVKHGMLEAKGEWI